MCLAIFSRQHTFENHEHKNIHEETPYIVANVFCPQELFQFKGLGLTTKYDPDSVVAGKILLIERTMGPLELGSQCKDLELIDENHFERQS